MTIGIIALIVVAILILLGVGQRILDKLHLNDKLALLCIAAMIGLGCFGNPRIFRQARALLDGKEKPDRPPLAQRCETALRQIELAAELRGERVAVLEGRKQYCWYLKGIAHSGYYKEQIVRMNTLEDARAVTRGIQRDLTD